MFGFASARVRWKTRNHRSDKYAQILANLRTRRLYSVDRLQINVLRAFARVR